jgi:hypothetical protein
MSRRWFCEGGWIGCASHGIGNSDEKTRCPKAARFEVPLSSGQRAK